MLGKKIVIEQFSKPVKFQPSKAYDVCEDGIEKIPQGQTRKVDSSKPYHPEKDFRFPETLFGNQKWCCQLNGLKNIHGYIMMSLVTPSHTISAKTRIHWAI